ncbi:ribosome hibernation-promoting factor, HPF/YfiA family [Salegentibacter chungangensis]|uniref:Ribosome hibernation-promoting factor, HPF/YfiA family n=1 Tax=Salegentibacter chungangensis TaxID=1335724 RepID=A0ABW3NSI5_9FLAO
MDVIFEFVKLEKSEALEAFTRKKLEKLENKYDFVIKADVHFKKEDARDTNAFMCNIRLSVPGPEVFAESSEDSFEAAVARSVKDLEKQLEKRKAKMSTH